MVSEKTYTIEQFIQSNSNTVISYEKLSLIEKMDNIYTITYNLLNDYKEELDDLAITINLTDEELIKYAYKPKLLAYDIYGSTELYFIILFINNICNVKEFNSKKIKMLSRDDLYNVLSAIYNAESDTIRKNRNKVEI